MLVCSVVYAQDIADKDTADSGLVGLAAGMVEDMLDMLTIEKGRNSLSIYPTAGYSPRTGFELGVMPVWRIKPNDRIHNRWFTMHMAIDATTRCRSVIV